MDPNTHVHGQTHMYTFAENSSEDKRATPAGLKEKHSKVPRDCKPYAPQLVREHTHGHALLERERETRCVPMIEHTGGDARQSERLTDTGLVVATDSAPRIRKTNLLQGA